MSLHPARHLTFANVASATALVVALGGGGAAVAAGLAKNSVGSPQIENGAIKSADVKTNALTGKVVRESSLGTVPSAASVETVQEAPRVTATVGQTRVVAKKGPLTITLRCEDDGGTTRGWVELATSVDNAAFDANVSGSDNGDLDIADGPVEIGSESGTEQDIEHLGFSALTPTGVQWQGYGVMATEFGGTDCMTELLFLG